MNIFLKIISLLVTITYTTYGILLVVSYIPLFMFCFGSSFSGCRSFLHVSDIINDPYLRFTLLPLLIAFCIFLFFISRLINVKVIGHYFYKDLKFDNLIKIKPKLTITEVASPRGSSYFSYDIFWGGKKIHLSPWSHMSLTFSNNEIKEFKLPTSHRDDPIEDQIETNSFYHNFVNQDIYLLNVTSSICNKIYILNKDTNSCILANSLSNHLKTPFLSLLNWILITIFSLALLLILICIFGESFTHFFIIAIVLSSAFGVYIFMFMYRIDKKLMKKELFHILKNESSSGKKKNHF